MRRELLVMAACVAVAATSCAHTAYEGGVADADGGRILPVVLQESYRAFGNSGGDVSIRACDRLEELGTAEGVCRGVGAISLAVADMDGDGLPELLVYRAHGKAEIWWNEGSSYTLETLLQISEPVDQDGSLVYGGATSATVDQPAFRQLRALGVVDADGDGRPDIILTPSQERPDLVVLRNLGERRFERNPSRATAAVRPGLADSIATGDLNGDGIADIIHSVRTTSASPPPGGEYNLRLFLSTGQGPWYREATEETIPLPDAARGGRDGWQRDLGGPYQPFSVSLGDMDGDGDLDVWAAADQGRSRLLRNDGGVFRDVTAAAGVENSTAGMGSRLQDVNGDGLLDIISTEIRWEEKFCPQEMTSCDEDRLGNRVHLNRGGMRFVEVAEQLGLQDTGYAWGFSSTDLNGDGWWDLFVGVGEMSGRRENMGWSSSFQRPYLMLGGPEGWTDRTGDVFRSLHMPGTSVMVASADMDGDLRPDLIVNGRESSSPHLLLNRTPTGSYATVLVQGSGPGGSPTGGEGAVVQVRMAGRPVWAFTAGGWVSNYRVHGAHLPLPVSAGPEGVAEVTVTFPSGVQVTRTVQDGQRAVIREEG